MNKTTVLAVLDQQYKKRIIRIADLIRDNPDHKVAPADQKLYDRLHKEAKILLEDMDRVKAMSAEKFALLYGN